MPTETSPNGTGRTNGVGAWKHRLARDRHRVEPPNAPPSCCARLSNGGWCVLPDDHEGEHEGIAAQYQPTHPPADHRITTLRTCWKLISGTESFCLLPRGHRGGCRGNA